MRVLFTFAGGSGHAEPLVPLARAARAAGHAVAFAGRPSVTAWLAEAGFAVFPDTGDDADPPPPPEPTPLVPYDAANEDRILREGFAGRAARRRAAVVLDVCARWAPDAIVCDEVDFGAMVAAERAGVPHATVVVAVAGGFLRPEVVAAPLDALRAAYGLGADPGLAMPARHLLLAPGPPRLRDPADPLPATALGLGRSAPEPRPHARTTVYFTLGTVFNVESGDLFGRVLEALRGLDRSDVVATVGRGVDPGRLGPQPPNVRVAAHLPQAETLAGCDVVVSHAGSGTVLDTLAAGLPSVLLPLGADQPRNAARCVALGAALALDPLRATPDEIRAAVRTVLELPGYRAAARQLRDEGRALAGPEVAVARLEALTRGV